MPNIELGAGGREQLPLTVYVWVVVFFEEPGINKIFSGLWHGWPWNINCCGVSGEVGGKWSEFAILVGVCLPSEALR